MTDAKLLMKHLPDSHTKVILTKDGGEQYRIKNGIAGVFVLQTPYTPMSVYFDEIVPQDCNDTAMLVRKGEVTARIPYLSGYALSKEKLRYWE